MILPPQLRRYSAAVAVLLACVFVPSLAGADEVWLRNGDRISGKILRMENEKLEIKPGYASTIYIDWKDVKGLSSSTPLSLRFRTGVPVPDNVGVRDGDRVVVLKVEQGELINLANVRSVNQADWFVDGQLTIGGNATKGNTNTTALNSSTDWTIRYNRHKFSINGQFNRAEADGELTVENGRGGLGYDYFITRNIFALLRQTYEQDTFQNLAQRTTSTAGLGYEFLNFKSHRLSVGAGPTAVFENFTTKPSTVSPSATWFLDWYRELFGDIVKLFHRHQGFRDFGAVSAFRFNATQGIRVKVYTDFNITFEYQFRFNSRPAPGRKDFDSSLITGLTFEFRG